MENNNVNEIINGLYSNAGCDMTPPVTYDSGEAAIADNGGLASALELAVDEKRVQARQIWNHWDAVESKRPLTSEENDIARESLIAVRRDIAEYRRALVGAKAFDAIGSYATVN
jgi:hypothetical protein